MAESQLDAIVHRTVEHQPTLISEGVGPPYYNGRGVTHINTFLGLRPLHLSPRRLHLGRPSRGHHLPGASLQRRRGHQAGLRLRAGHPPSASANDCAAAAGRAVGAAGPAGTRPWLAGRPSARTPGQPSIRRNLFLRARGKVRMEAMSLLPSPLAKCERLCYSVPMKSAAGPPLFLGACRITSVLGANHGESPCGRGAEGTTQGARPSEEGRGRSECGCEASSLELSRSATARNESVTPCNAFVTPSCLQTPKSG